MNPYLPLYEYIPDGEPRIFGDRLYVYGSHDFAGGELGFCPGVLVDDDGKVYLYIGFNMPGPVPEKFRNSYPPLPESSMRIIEEDISFLRSAYEDGRLTEERLHDIKYLC